MSTTAVSVGEFGFPESPDEATEVLVRTLSTSILILTAKAKRAYATPN